jgi:hypothetical protein
MVDLLVEATACPICRAIADANPHPITDLAIDPPVHPNCVISSTKVDSQSARLVTARHYQGPVVEMDTDNRTLWITPNHPVLTPKGFVPANQLEAGDTILVIPDQDSVTPIGEIWEHGQDMKVSTSDIGSFHGDGHGDYATKLVNDLVIPEAQVADEDDFETLMIMSGRAAAEVLVSAREIQFDTHVFNLETTEGWYSANGVIVHNCRCALTPVMGG